MAPRRLVTTASGAKKYDLRVAAYGTLDEANAALGIARLHTADDAALDAALARIQNDLFDLGADLTMPGKGKGPGGERLTATDNQVNWLESEIDRLNAELAPLRRSNSCCRAAAPRRPICISRARYAGAASGGSRNSTISPAKA